MDSSQAGNVLLTQECFIHWHFYEPNCSSFIFKTILKIYPINLQICISTLIFFGTTWLLVEAPNTVIVQAGGSVGGLQVAGGFVINYIYQC